MVRSEGNISLKNPVTPPGIDPGTVRLVAQRRNHYADSGPSTFQYFVRKSLATDLSPRSHIFVSSAATATK